MERVSQDKFVQMQEHVPVEILSRKFFINMDPISLSVVIKV